MSADRWDYIIVGAGSAGCALAHQLAESGRAKILVLEAGGRDTSPFIRFVCAQGKAVARHDWGYRSQPDPSRNGAAEAWPRGRVVGGSSSINGTLYARGAASDFDRWAESVNDASWSAREVMPIFESFERRDRERSPGAAGGPLHVRAVRLPHPVTDSFIASARASGYAFNPDYNGEHQEGVAYAQLSQWRGLRWSAADAFLKPLLGRAGVKLLTQAVVQRIEVESSRAVAVSFLHEGRQRRESASDIVLCAGAINSPKLLMLSGIGDVHELDRHGIRCVLDLPGVGRNLSEHPLLKLVYRMRVPTYNPVNGLPQKIGFALQFARTREGPISNLFESVAFLKSRLDAPHPDIQLHFLPIGYETTPQGTIRLACVPSVTVLLNVSHPVSRGRIALASARPDDAPRIECRLLEALADVDTLLRGISVVRKIMAAEPIASLVEQEMSPGVSVQSESAMIEHVRNNVGLAFHPAGTCRMGTGPDAVVRTDLSVRGIDNLWIADASVMPDLVSGNTNAVCMMIGQKLGRQLAARAAVSIAVNTALKFF